MHCSFSLSCCLSPSLFLRIFGEGCFHSSQDQLFGLCSLVISTEDQHPSGQTDNCGIFLPLPFGLIPPPLFDWEFQDPGDILSNSRGCVLSTQQYSTRKTPSDPLLQDTCEIYLGFLLSDGCMVALGFLLVHREILRSLRPRLPRLLSCPRASRLPRLSFFPPSGFPPFPAGFPLSSLLNFNICFPLGLYHP